MSISTTADVAMIRGLLDRALDLHARLDTQDQQDKDWRERVADALDRLPSERVGADGRVAEWSTELCDAEPKHRHMSHLFGVYPAERIRPDSTPDLAEAALRTLIARGGYSTGWSLAWRVSLRARLRDGDGAHTALRAFLASMPDDVAESPAMGPGGVYRSLLCAHPPFQIDGRGVDRRHDRVGVRDRRHRPADRRTYRGQAGHGRCPCGRATRGRREGPGRRSCAGMNDHLAS
ncbi:hypothetical protein ABZV93_00480 [Actinopolymorpha sp. NPDC004070]|uniref:glycosyl hydrolase family 95 catalytic domain-containing protein n=1 Tax=Actinopolymorpha sp. NPDC004070 TaxID=3154548 RepID=UPI0033AF363D